MITTRVLDTQRLSTLANGFERDIVQFLRDLIAIPAVSCHEGPVIQRIRQEMEKVGFEEIRIDLMGNILGRIGSGKTIVMMDAHADTVGVGDPKEWAWDPHAGKVEDGFVYGRGASHQRAGMASLVYAGKLIYELGMYDDFTLWVVGSVQKEDCDGLAWLHILKEDGIHPDCVLMSEPTNLRIHRGQRGRAEIEVRMHGKSCHGATPERGGNAIYKMARLIGEVEHLNQRLKHDSFLGKGTVAVTQVGSLAPSSCTVPSLCCIRLDRRLTAGESRESALAEIRSLPGAEEAEVEILRYDRPSYTGLSYHAEKFFPAWVLGESHALTQAAIATYETLFELPPVIGKWNGSTNGVGSMGLGVPTIGFGPGEEDVAHTPGERVPIRHLVKAAQFYAAFPLMYVESMKRR